MPEPRHLHLGAFIRPVAIHTGAWRYPGALPDANFNLAYMKHLARQLEAAKFDFLFMADHLAVLNMPVAALRRSHTVTSFEPFTLLSAFAAITERIGLVATASTTFDAPYHIARRFASLDHISGGRAGWNIVTTANPDAAKNFGGTEMMEHDARYGRAREFYDVVTGLWDSFDDDAFLRDVEAGLYFDPDKMHALNHKGASLDVRGPLNIARPVQGWPVIVQAGSSDAGRQLAAETAEVVFGSELSLDSARRYYADIKRRMRALGRDPAHCKIMPAVFVVVGETDADARETRAHLDSLVHYDNGIGTLNGMLGADVSGYDPDGPLPDIPASNATRGSQAKIVAEAREKSLTIRQLAQKAGSAMYFSLVGSPATIADGMEEWLAAEACDGFNVMISHHPQGLDDFTRRVVPELQRRGVFRHEYEGATLRDHLGLPRPASRYAA